MFNIRFLHTIRAFEYKQITARLRSGVRVLEIGGGTGYQARQLSEDGFEVESIDIHDSNYADQHVFQVAPYDGKHIPFPDKSFDVIFSSNVLEHVSDLPYLQVEIKRVLRPDGICIHLMPTPSWRFWTNIAHYVELIQRLCGLAPGLLPRSFSRQAIRDTFSVLHMMSSTTNQYAIVPRHGETGNAFSEIVLFSTENWITTFTRHGFVVNEVTATGLFYTGHMILGPWLSISARRKLSRLLGSACAIYVVRPEEMTTGF